MKTKRKEVVEYKTIYVSEDDLYESEDPKKVEEYEATCNYKTFKPVLTLLSSLINRGNTFEIFKCETKKDYQDFLSFCKQRYRSVSKYGIINAEEKYNDKCKYWTVTIWCGCGEGPDEIVIDPIDNIIQEVEEVKVEVENLNTQYEKIKKLLYDNKDSK